MNDGARSQLRTEDKGAVLPSHEQSERANTHSAALDGEQTIAIAASFAADLLIPPLQFGIGQWEISATIVQASHAQLLDELRNPQSLLSCNQLGSA